MLGVGKPKPVDEYEAQGETERVQPVEYGERLAWDIPGARLVRIPHARHFVMLARPDEVLAQLAYFLR